KFKGKLSARDRLWTKAIHYTTNKRVIIKQLKASLEEYVPERLD
ncbi:12943_t:CDS:1, partial [Funneliformis mosseae]